MSSGFAEEGLGATKCVSCSVKCRIVKSYSYQWSRRVVDNSLGQIYDYDLTSAGLYLSHMWCVIVVLIRPRAPVSECSAAPV